MERGNPQGSISPASPVATRAVRHHAWVSFAVKMRICALPCAICGRRDDIECDHVVSIRSGGRSEESNLQPLCRTCNSIKGSKRTNEDVRAWIERNPERFKRSQEFRTKRLSLIARGEWR